MKRIEGITIEKAIKGKTRYIRIDMNKYGEEIISFFREKGIEIDPEEYDPKFVEKIKKAEKEESQKIDLSEYGISI
jgi:hypothetical protein